MMSPLPTDENHKEATTTALTARKATLYVGESPCQQV